MRGQYWGHVTTIDQSEASSLAHLLLVAPDAVLGEVHLMDHHGAIPVQDLYPVLTAQHQQGAALHRAPDQ